MIYKEEYVIKMRNLKQLLNRGLVLKKVYKVIKLKQKAWLKPYFDMSTDLRKQLKNINGNDFFKLFLM